MGAYRRDPYPGYARVSINQIAQADFEIFKMLQEKCREGIQRVSGGARPLEVHLDDVLKDQRVTTFLQPLATSASSSSKRTRSASPGSNAGPSNRTLKKKRAHERKKEAEAKKASELAAMQQQFAAYKKGKGNALRFLPL